MSRPPEDRNRQGRPRTEAGGGSRQSAASPARWTSQNVGEVYYELRPVGAYMRVNIIHAATGFETFALAPIKTTRAHLKQLALRKLIAGLNNQG